MIVAGIDPSLTGTGIAVWHGRAGACMITSIGKTGITNLPVRERVLAMDKLVFEISTVIFDAQLVLIESPSYESKFSAGKTERNYLYWSLIHRAAVRDQLIAIVAPKSRAGYATGRAGANKLAVADAIARRLPQLEAGGDENKADAIVLMAMGLDAAGEPLCTMPATHRKFLTGVKWPEDRGWMADEFGTQ